MKRMNGWAVAAVMVAAGMVAMGAGAEEAKKEAKGCCGTCKKCPDPKAMFAKWDANSDGQVSKDEFVASHGEKANKEGMEKRFAKWDADSDGTLTKEEFKASCDKRKEAAGKNKEAGKGKKKGGKEE